MSVRSHKYGRKRLDDEGEDEDYVYDDEYTAYRSRHDDQYNEDSDSSSDDDYDDDDDDDDDDEEDDDEEGEDKAAGASVTRK